MDASLLLYIKILVANERAMSYDERLRVVQTEKTVYIEYWNMYN